jgi:hypothetical protein
MDYPLKKLEYDGTIMLRDYSVEDCVKKNENMRIILSDEVMTLSPEDLVTKFVSRPSQVHESKFEGGLKYRLIGYNWEPDQVEL